MKQTNTLPKSLITIFLMLVALFPLVSLSSSTLGFQMPRWGIIAYWVVLSAAVGYMVYGLFALTKDNQKLKTALKQTEAELKKQTDALEELSFTDPLTRVYNRRYFNTVVPDDVTRILRRFDSKQDLGTNRSLVFLLLDVDNLNNINDRFGRFKGDKLLKQVGGRLNSITRKSDLVVRWGEDEFLVMLRDADPSEGNRIAKRMLDLVGNDRFDLSNGDTVRCTCSVGWATYPWWEKSPSLISYDQVLELSEKALGLAQQSGGNRSYGVMPTDNKGNPSLAVDILKEIGTTSDENLYLLDNDGPEITRVSLKAPPSHSLT